MSKEASKEKTLYFLTPDYLGHAFVARNEEDARRYAEEDPDIFDAEDCECHQITDDDDNPITLPDKEFGDKIGIEEGLRKGVYDWAEYDIECEECGKLSSIVHSDDGDIICDECFSE